MIGFPYTHWQVDADMPCAGNRDPDHQTLLISTREEPRAGRTTSLDPHMIRPLLVSGERMGGWAVPSIMPDHGGSLFPMPVPGAGYPTPDTTILPWGESYLSGI